MLKRMSETALLTCTCCSTLLVIMQKFSGFSMSANFFFYRFSDYKQVIQKNHKENNPHHSHVGKDRGENKGAHTKEILLSRAQCSATGRQSAPVTQKVSEKCFVDQKEHMQCVQSRKVYTYHICQHIDLHIYSHFRSFSINKTKMVATSCQRLQS